MAKENMESIIAFRCCLELKQQMQREAKERNMTLSDFIFECIEEGYKIVKRRDVKQSQFSEK